MSTSFPNIWHHRKVAETSARGCEICFKPSTSVLVNPENKDFFYVCPSHLKEKSFCSPVINQEAIAARKKKEQDEELERLKKEYEEKQKKKKEKEKEDKKKDDVKKGEKDAGSEDNPKSEEKDRQDDKSSPAVEEEPRVFALQRNFHQQRIDRRRQAEMAKRNRERLSNPNCFPSVPKSQP